MKKFAFIFFVFLAAQFTTLAESVDEMIAGMTLRQKVGQLFFIRPESLQLDKQTPAVKLTEAMREHFELYPCGGVILFAQNCIQPEQLKEFTASIHSLDHHPLVGIDEEGGRVQRLGGHKEFGLAPTKAMQTVAKHGGAQAVQQAIRNICTYLRDFGIDIDFAPVADVDSNPVNPIIGQRAFSSDAATVAMMVEAAIKEFQADSIISCLKHFPGHGDTSTDTHKGYATISKTWERMLECEILPFKAGIAAGAPMVMTAHITAENLDSLKRPSSLSETVLTDKLRGELGFNGVIVTDGMDMGAITSDYSCEEATLLAIKAGADVILCPQDYQTAFNAVLSALENGELTEKRIDQSVRRILSMKAVYLKL